MARREFSKTQKEAIVERSKRKGQICCERCHQVLGGKPHEIDHIIPEANRPDADKKRPLTLDDGQLLCLPCHRGPGGKTAQDIKDISKARRQYLKHNGLWPKSKAKIQSRGFSNTRAYHDNEA